MFITITTEIGDCLVQEWFKEKTEISSPIRSQVSEYILILYKLTNEKGR